jgi:protein-tyrosine phosphatase
MIHGLSEADLIKLAELNICSAFDLRSERECRQFPHSLSGHARVQYWSMNHDSIDGNITRMLSQQELSQSRLRDAMTGLYRSMPYTFNGIYAQLFRRILHDELPLVFNCAAGKDRTGVAAALLLSALGVEWDVTLADYMLTETVVPDLMQTFRDSGYGSKMLLNRSSEEVVPLFCVDRAYLEAMRHEIHARSGSFELFFSTELGLNGAAIEQLRDRLLT